MELGKEQSLKCFKKFYKKWNYHTPLGRITYKELNTKNRKHIRELAEVLYIELEANSRPTQDYMENQFCLLRNMVASLYLLQEYNKLKRDYNKINKLSNYLI